MAFGVAGTFVARLDVYQNVSFCLISLCDLQCFRFNCQRFDHLPAPFLARKGVLNKPEKTGDTPVPSAEGCLCTPSGDKGDPLTHLPTRTFGLVGLE